MSKRGQITVFILVGIIALLALLIIFYARPLVEEVPEEVISQVSTYVTGCVENHLEDAIFLAGFQGGYIDLSEDVDTYPTFYSDVPFWFDQGNDKSLDKEFVEKQISSYMDQSLLLCVLRMNIPGYEISLDAPETETKITDEMVVAEVNMPVLVSREGFESTRDRFIARIPVRLGKILEESSQIVEMLGEAPETIDMSFLLGREIQNTVYSVDEHTKLFTIRDDESSVKNEPYAFTFATRLEKVEKNHNPIMDEIPEIRLGIGEMLTLDVNATDEDGDELFFSIVSDGFEIDETNGKILIIGLEPGTYQDPVTVEDGKGGTDFDYLVVNVV